MKRSKWKNSKLTRTVIVVPDCDPNSSSFIVALRERLPTPKDFLFGGGIPSNSYYNGYILKPGFSDRIKFKFKKIDIKPYLFEKYLKRQKTTTIIAEYGIAAVSILDSCKKLNIKLITHFHGFDVYEKAIINKYSSHYKDVFEYSHAIISVSKHMTNQLIQMGAPKNKIVYNPCAPNEVFFEVKPAYNSNSFISIGRFVDKKAPYYTILAFKKVNEQFPESKLIMVGDGPLLNSCINLTNYYGLKQQIEFKGSQKHEEIQKLMAECFCFVQHSVTALNGDSEGTPVAVFEASAAGLPVIATRHAGIPDIVIENETGFLVNEHDVDSMADKMKYLFENRDVSKKFGVTGKKHIRANYSMEEYIRTIINETIA